MTRQNLVKRARQLGWQAMCTVDDDTRRAAMAKKDRLVARMQPKTRIRHGFRLDAAGPPNGPAPTKETP